MDVIVFVKKKIIALDQHPRARTDVVAQGSDAREIAKDLQFGVDTEEKAIRRAGIFAGDITPDVAKLLFRASRDDDLSHARCLPSR